MVKEKVTQRHSLIGQNISDISATDVDLRLLCPVDASSKRTPRIDR